MPSTSLHSNHVNYLVFRYLQESGFENAAVALGSDWHRSSDCRDPENLAFAHAVARGDLISLIQAGLQYERLVAKAKGGSLARFTWSEIDARASTDRHDERAENGARPASSRRQDRLPHSRAQDDFPTPAPKRQRRSEGSEPQLNGDREAVEADAASAEGDEEDVASPAAASEPEVVERYDSMEAGTQTVAKADPKTITTSWTLDKPGASILHGVWCPTLEDADTSTLMTAGEDFCRFYQVPRQSTDVKQLTHHDDPCLPPKGQVTSVAWRPDGQAACCAMDGLRELPDGGATGWQLIFEHRQDGDSTTLEMGPVTLEPNSSAIILQYSPDGEFLLAVRTNRKRCLLQIWPSASYKSEKREPREAIAWKVFDGMVNEAAWVTGDTFLVCGDGGLSAVYQVDKNHQQEVGELPAASVGMRGLIPRNSSFLEGTTEWDRLQIHRHGIAVLASMEERRMIVSSRLQEHSGQAPDDVEIGLPPEANLDVLCIQPCMRSSGGEDAMEVDQQNSTLLAAAFDDGRCHIYSISWDADGGLSVSTPETIALLGVSATALAWSPNGEHLALANESLMQIWHSKSLKRRHGENHRPRASVTWKPVSHPNGLQNGHLEGEEVQDTLISLSWSADGESLSFCAEREVSVIHFTPSLHDDSQQSLPNGHHGT